MVKAVIDMGTNTIKCAIAKVEGAEVMILEDINRKTQLGAELAATGNIGLAAMERNLAVLKEIREVCLKLGVEKVVCVGAETMRRAADADVFRDRVSKELGWQLRTLAKEEEALLTFQSSAAMAPAGVLALVVDSGGGSTEFTFGRDSTILKKHSLPLGAVTLTKEFLSTDPVGETDFSQLNERIKTLLESELSVDETPHAIACGGSLTALASVSLTLESFDADRIQGFQLSREEVLRQIGIYKSLDLNQRAQLKGMPQGRADIILAGAAIVLGIMRHFDLAGMTVSTYGIRHVLLTNELPAEPA